MGEQIHRLNPEEAAIRSENSGEFKVAWHLYSKASFNARVFGDMKKSAALGAKAIEMYGSAFTPQEKQLLDKIRDKDAIRKSLRLLESLGLGMPLDKGMYESLGLTGNPATAVHYEISGRCREAAGSFRDAAYDYSLAAKEIFNGFSDDRISRSQSLLSKAQELNEISKNDQILVPCYFSEYAVSDNINYVRELIEEEVLKEGRRE